MRIFKTKTMSFVLTALSTSRRQYCTSTAFLHSRIGNTSRNNSIKPVLRASFLDDLQNAFSTMVGGGGTDGASNPSSSKYYTVGITGSSGLLGTALIDELSKMEDGKLNGKPMRIVKLTRSDSVVDDEGDDAEDIDEGEEDMMITSQPWNPNAESPSSTISSSTLTPIDAIVHLAGENVATSLLPGPLADLGVQAWSEEKKRRIVDSRVGPTGALAEAISGGSTPTAFIVASGVGIYGYDFMEEDEDATMTPDESFDTSGTEGFLAELSRGWEAAAQPVSGGGNNMSRVVNLRLAPIMSKLGGALGKLYPIFFLGGGGNVGSGKQYFSFISARDAARAIVHVIETPSLTGPVNLVAPTPCTNAQFTQALGKVLSRPTIVPLPGFVVKLLFGEMGEEMLLGGVKATPKKLLGSGFNFRHGTIEEGLESAMEENI